ncbi:MULTISPECIES: EamA family transporter [unclassified Mesorhizobium]|uniref:DMT family transporter n=1 Tax=unclassified Mesorhizobium TaxID=325217 RepID=UPI000BAF1C9D|nr:MULTISPECIES: EamA family transporter [unclassified Mesorhizobium]TGT61001.1 EamA family transporter [Mesorhizobium sp. M00.F.Ca.ET.170.01.1.1]AZO08770.1 EamA family transporter [Mesorhizobium sp. M3A.F.Ca.ET.080.04.2.1]PBB84082.1 EamA family transporter [Mesorhizobium sp. WSM3876]RWB72105.1 MAG: EamA family transporter [Mesorhizobium sp.]RWB83690.1 MAG: EamA family transporter [Mesorhizobium sp.]
MQAMPIAHHGERSAVAAMSSLSGYPAAVLCWLLSAGVYIAAKWVAPEMPPWGLCFWRLALACAILLPIVHRHHGAMIALLKTRALEIVAVGAIGLTICQGMIYHGLADTDATTAGIIMALSPVMTMVLARFVLGEPLGLWQSVGAAIALVGMLVIVAHGDLTALLQLRFNLGELWIVGSALCWALYTVLVRRAKFGIELLPLVVLLLGAGALVALPFHLWELANDERSTMNANGLLALAYLAGPGGALMYYLYNRSVETLGASRASMLLYLQTMFVAILAYLLLGESLHDYDLLGAVFIVAGIVLATVLKPKPVPARAA